MVELVGELVAVEWDSNDEPLEICLETEVETYGIAEGEEYEALLDYVGHQVRIQGIIDEAEDGKPMVLPKSFELLDVSIAGLDDFEEQDEDGYEFVDDR